MSELDVPTTKSGQLSTPEAAASAAALAALPELVGTANEIDEIAPASRSSNHAMMRNSKS